jgi:hypothetical protein
MGMRTGQGKAWTAQRVGSMRRVCEIPAYRSATKRGKWLTMSDAASMLGVTNCFSQRLIHDRILAAEPVVPGALCQIRVTDLNSLEIGTATDRNARPRCFDSENEVSVLHSLMKDVHDERFVAVGRCGDACRTAA